MNKSDLSQNQTWAILGGAAIMLTLAMGAVMIGILAGTAQILMNVKPNARVVDERAAGTALP